MTDVNWKRSHRARRALWQSLNHVGLTGLHTAPAHRSWLHVERLDMPLPGLGDKWVGKRLIQISDLHLSPFVTRTFLRRQLDHVTDLRPDVVAVTGDLVTGGYRFAPRLARLLTQLGCPHVVCILGNHDYTARGKADPAAGQRHADHLTEHLIDAGHVVLRNDAVDLGGLTFVGLDDLWTSRLDADAAFTTIDGGPVICLNHDPRNARSLVDHPWRWMLSGHTHGRQLATSVVGRHLNKKRRRPFVAGRYELAPGRDLYVNRGLSYGQRAKGWCRPEITVFKLTRDVDSRVTA